MEQCQNLDLEVRTSRLRCRAGTEDLKDLELVVTTAEDASKLERLFEEAYSQEVRDIELRHLDNIHISKEGNQILWYHPGPSIQVFTRNGATVLAITLGVWQYGDRAHDSAFLQDLLRRMTVLSQEIEFPDVNASEAEISSGGRGLFSGLQDFQ